MYPANRPADGIMWWCGYVSACVFACACTCMGVCAPECFTVITFLCLTSLQSRKITMNFDMFFFSVVLLIKNVFISVDFGCSSCTDCRILQFSSGACSSYLNPMDLLKPSLSNWSVAYLFIYLFACIIGLWATCAHSQKCILIHYSANYIIIIILLNN